jgi:hypothetical protein
MHELWKTDFGFLEVIKINSKTAPNFNLSFCFKLVLLFIVNYEDDERFAVIFFVMFPC